MVHSAISLCTGIVGASGGGVTLTKPQHLQAHTNLHLWTGQAGLQHPLPYPRDRSGGLLSRGFLGVGLTPNLRKYHMGI